jgi:hypothetical protein
MLVSNIFMSIKILDTAIAKLAPVRGLLVMSANNPLRSIPLVKQFHWGDFGGIVHHRQI